MLQYGSTALIMAAYEATSVPYEDYPEWPDMVEKLLAAGADVNAAKPVGCFPVPATLLIYTALRTAHSPLVGGGSLMRAWLYAAGWQDGSDIGYVKEK